MHNSQVTIVLDNMHNIPHFDWSICCYLGLNTHSIVLRPPHCLPTHCFAILQCFYCCNCVMIVHMFTLCSGGSISRVYYYGSVCTSVQYIQPHI